VSLLRPGLTPRCDRCGKRKPIKRTDGIPAMIGFVLKDGRTVNMCAECLEHLGELDETGRDEFFSGLNL